MARKTSKSNKTNHVLNLLSTGGTDAVDAKNPPVNPNNSSVEVVQTNQEVNDLSENIRKSLEETLPIENNPDKKESDEMGTTDIKDISFDKKAIEKHAENEMIHIPEDRFNEHKDTDFRFVSVMEIIVKEVLEAYLEKFGLCDCSRCRADVMALALTNLPSKYVVVDSVDLSPIMNYYVKKYEALVTVELTKACIKIKDHPHHD